jgi:hypothetical protein
MVGRALHLDTPGDIVGIYATVGAGGALVQLHGVKAGVELSANVGGVEITME